jgi:hypothetical protein
MSKLKARGKIRVGIQPLNTAKWSGMQSMMKEEIKITLV